MNSFMTKAKELLYPVGIESLFIAFMTGGKDSRSAIPTYDTEIYQMDNIVEIGIAGNPTSITKWASNKMFVNASKNSNFTLTLTHVALPQEVMDKINGVTPVKGIAFNKSDVKEYPMFALGFIAPLSDGSKIARWYPRVQKTPAEETYGTISEEAEVRDQSLTMNATPLLFNNVTEVDFSEVRASAVGINVEDFMAQVVADESQLDTLFPGTGITVAVDPSSASVAPSGTQQLTATVTGATDTSVTWSSSDETVATVDTAGLVTIDAAATTGETATITATSVEDAGATDSALITVS
jgi:phi13 family phage major tail protein